MEHTVLMLEGGENKREKGRTFRERSKLRGRSKSKGMTNIICWNCGEKGHPKRECPHSKKKGGKSDHIMINRKIMITTH